MRSSTWGLVAAVAGLAVLLWAAPRRQGIALPGEAPEGGAAAPLPGPLESLFLGATVPSESPIYDPRDYQARTGNQHAFLTTIAASEGTDQAGGYRALYGSRSDSLSTFISFADHPALQYPPWPGVPLSDEMCRNAGYPPGCVSTAAGRYQIIRPTWRELKVSLGLPDFSPESQDRAALELIRRNGALELVDAGDFDGAVARVRKVWASLPGAGYGQHENELAALRGTFVEAGGVLSA
jgi:muramidase (phage lysozyme)